MRNRCFPGFMATPMSIERAIEPVLAHARERPDAPALEVAGDVWTYRELLAAAASIAKVLPASGDAEQPKVAIMAHREASAYIGILAAQLNGCAYVPINVAHPATRSAGILAASGATHVIVGDLAREKLSSILAVHDRKDEIELVAGGDRKADYDFREKPVLNGETRPNDIAYILFTSGSTGTPKGVPIGHGQLGAYLTAAQSLLPELSPSDRFSQCFDLTFDLSVHDVFLSWRFGATLVVPSVSELENPAGYIVDKGITAWFSVPSLAYQMRLQGNLSKGAFPTLKTSLFCGEALPSALALEWTQAASNSRVANWYGPTEATIACAHYEVTGNIDAPTVPIGRPFPNMSLHVLDAQLQETDQGELYLSGPQLAEGYLNDPEKTAKAFLTLPDGAAAYRTGDLAKRDDDGIVYFLGRTDTQLKLRGFRIELGEVETVLRNASGGSNAVALPWPPDETPRALVAAVEGKIDQDAIREDIAAHLPDYMRPSEFVAFERFPRNASGKADRAAIARVVQEHLSGDAQLGDMTAEERHLLEAIRRAAPAVSVDSALTSPSLLDAGMDSLSFVEFTMTLQEEFGVTLDEAGVVSLSEMPFAAIVKDVARRRTGRKSWTSTLTSRLSKSLKRQRRSAKRRANRAIQFIERFPGVLREDGPPIVLAVGSSGTFRAIDPKVLEQYAPYRVLNVGLPAVTADGITQICHFVRRECEAAGQRLALVLYEFDPMHISTTPPSGDISLGPEFFTGKMRVETNVSAAREFEWVPEAGGAWQPEMSDTAQERRPEWAKKRERLIAEAYLGDIAFDPQRLALWQSGARELRHVSDKILGFVHPADQAMLDQVVERPTKDALQETLQSIHDRLDIAFVPWNAFTLEPDDYMNINHANPRGRARLSEQLAAYLFGEPAGADPASADKTGLQPQPETHDAE